MKSTVRTQLVIAAIVTVPALIISFLAGISLGLPQVPPEIAPVDAVPVSSVPGQDVPGLPRFPGSARVKYENHQLGDARVWEVGYFAEGTVREAGSFYRQKLNEKGWVLEGTDFDAGELDLRAHKGDVVVLIELTQANELIEIEVEVYEPLPS